MLLGSAFVCKSSRPLAVQVSSLLLQRLPATIGSSIVGASHPQQLQSRRSMNSSTSTSTSTSSAVRNSSSTATTHATSTTSFRAWKVNEHSDGTFGGSDRVCSIDSLKVRGKNNYHQTDQNQSNNCSDEDEDEDEDGTVLIRVTHSSLNYKDALSASGNKGVTRSYPHTPGIDAAGILVGTGGSVLVTGYDLGMNTDGGFGEYIRVPSEWIVAPNPFASTSSDDAGVDAANDANANAASRLSMVYGTAGLTAALCVSKLLEAGNATPGDGRVLVTGASGGVGSVSVELLAKLGFDVVAVSGKATNTNANTRLLALGATEVVGREVLEETSKPLLRHEYAHAIDVVGGPPLAEVLKRIAPGGSVAACGNAAGFAVKTSVLPFILRGVQLLGVDSVEISLEEKRTMWTRLAGEWRCPRTEESVVDIGRHELGSRLGAMLGGESSGKIVLDHSISQEKTP